MNERGYHQARKGEGTGSLEKLRGGFQGSGEAVTQLARRSGPPRFIFADPGRLGAQMRLELPSLLCIDALLRYSRFVSPRIHTKTRASCLVLFEAWGSR